MPQAGTVVFQSRASTPRILASNTKLFTASAILAKLGRDRHAGDQLESDGAADIATPGVFTGNVYLHGGGDPTFGTQSFDRRFYGGVGPPFRTSPTSSPPPASPRSTGRIVGDESRFDSLRGGPSSGFGVSVVDLGGPLSALSFDRGLANENGGAIQRNPPLFAAQQLTSALKRRHIRVTRLGLAAASAVGRHGARVDQVPGARGAGRGSP